MTVEEIQEWVSKIDKEQESFAKEVRQKQDDFLAMHNVLDKDVAVFKESMKSLKNVLRQIGDNVGHSKMDIAKIGGGTGGLIYFIMELIRGLSG